jgi:hypothetical protein
MSDDKKIINFDTIAEEFRKVMTHEDISEPDREKIIGSVVDHVSNNPDSLVLREDVTFRSEADDE